MPIDKYFDSIYVYIQYSDDGKPPYKAAQIINNYFNMVLTTGPLNISKQNLVQEDLIR